LLTYNAASTVATGTQTDTQSLKLTDVGAINTAAAGAASNAKALDVTIAKVEALDLSGVADAKSIKITGAGQTEIQDVAAATTSFDASGATGNVIADLTSANTTALTTVKTGTGDDTVTVAAGDLTTTATVDGGSGADTLKLNGAGGTIQPSFAGFETIELAGITSALTFSGTNTSNITDVKVSGTNTAGASFVNMDATDLTVTTVGGQGNNIAADNSGAVTFNATATATASGTEANSGSATFDNASSLTVNVGEYVNQSGAISAAAAKEVTVNVASKVVNSVEQTQLSSAITAGEATTFTVTADGELASGSGIDAAKATSGSLTTGSTADADFDITAAKLTSLRKLKDTHLLESSNSRVPWVRSVPVQTQTAVSRKPAIAAERKPNSISCWCQYGAGMASGRLMRPVTRVTHRGMMRLANTASDRKNTRNG
jgi:hypothetical protein